MEQVTSRGCSRSFVVFVLHRCLENIQANYCAGNDITFPFNPADINKWLLQAKKDCNSQTIDYQISLGGTAFDERDPSTYWTLSQQFCTW